MTGLTAPPDHADPIDGVVDADGWYPPVSLADIRAKLRIGDGTVTTGRLTAAIEGAMITAFRALDDWKLLRVAAGALTLDQVTTITLNNVNYADLLWQRIIRNFAAAELGDLHRDISATDDGLDRADEKSATADDYRRLAYHAVSDLLSIGGDRVQRNTVSLI